MTLTAHLRSLLAAATPGPWQVQHGSWNSLVHDGDRPVSPSARAPDADLIVTLVNAGPALLAVVEAAEAFLRAYDDDGHEVTWADEDKLRSALAALDGAKGGAG